MKTDERESVTVGVTPQKTVRIIGSRASSRSLGISFSNMPVPSGGRTKPASSCTNVAAQLCSRLPVGTETMGLVPDPFVVAVDQRWSRQHLQRGMKSEAELGHTLCIGDGGCNRTR